MKKEFTKNALVGLNIKDARRRLGWSQRELAERVGVSQTAVSRYERGVVDLSLGLVAKMERALCTPLLAPVFRPEKGRKLYIAYGSNLNVEQMAYRCPDALPVGRAVIRDYRLVFRGVLTIEPYKGGEVPVGIWSISKVDEANLDIYEGFPRLYRKETLRLNADMFYGPTVSIDGIAYVMNEGRHPLAGPSEQYYNTCAEGYRRFGFDEALLWSAHGVNAAPYMKGGRYYA